MLEHFIFDCVTNFPSDYDPPLDDSSGIEVVENVRGSVCSIGVFVILFGLLCKGTFDTGFLFGK